MWKREQSSGLRAEREKPQSIDRRHRMLSMRSLRSRIRSATRSAATTSGIMTFREMLAAALAIALACGVASRGEGAAPADCNAVPG